MTDKEITFTLDLNDFFRTAVLSVLAIFAARVSLAISAVAIVRLTEGYNVWANLAILALAFGSLFTDVAIAGIIAFYVAAKGWFGEAIIVICVALIIVLTILYVP